MVVLFGCCLVGGFGCRDFFLGWLFGLILFVVFGWFNVDSPFSFALAWV